MSTKKQKQAEWMASEEGILFRKRQKDRLTKYSSPQERDSLRNTRRKERLKTDLDYYLQHKIKACKARAKKDNIPFDLDFDYIKSIYTEHCPYLGIKLSLRASSGNCMDSISVDKIIPHLGYVKGNVRIVSYKANVMKQDVPIETLIKFAKSVLEIHGES